MALAFAEPERGVTRVDPYTHKTIQKYGGCNCIPCREQLEELVEGWAKTHSVEFKIPADDFAYIELRRQA